MGLEPDYEREVRPPFNWLLAGKLTVVSYVSVISLCALFTNWLWMGGVISGQAAEKIASGIAGFVLATLVIGVSIVLLFVIPRIP